MRKLTALIESLRTSMELHESRFGGIDAADQLAQMVWFASHGQHVAAITELVKNLTREPWGVQAASVPVNGLTEWTREFRFALQESRSSGNSVGIRPEVTGLYQTLLETVDGGRAGTRKK